MIWNWYNRAALLKCETPDCPTDPLPFPLTWQPTINSIRFFAAACGWSYVNGQDLCLECTEGTKEVPHLTSTNPS